MATPGSPPGISSIKWQEKLEEHCRSTGASKPVYDIVSDRRGGRTAWSSIVKIVSNQQPFPQAFEARFWYDGQYINNAREDAAEVALKALVPQMPPPPASSQSISSSPPPGSAGGNDLNLRGGHGPGFSPSSMLPGLGSLPQQRQTATYGVAWVRSPPARQGLARPGW